MPPHADHSRHATAAPPPALPLQHTSEPWGALAAGLIGAFGLCCVVGLMFVQALWRLHRDTLLEGEQRAVRSGRPMCNGSNLNSRSPFTGLPGLARLAALHVSSGTSSDGTAQFGLPGRMPVAVGRRRDGKPLVDGDVRLPLGRRRIETAPSLHTGAAGAR